MRPAYIFIALFTFACGGSGHYHSPRNPDEMNNSSGLPARILTDRGYLSVERDYIPGVVACEIGKRRWGVAAMEAQAIAARTYLARFLVRTRYQKTVPIGPRFQCWKRTSNRSFIDVAKRTAGIVIYHNDKLITGNYVSGTRHLTFDCSPENPKAASYPFASWTEMLSQYRHDRKRAGRTLFSGIAWTEIFVTRNEGKSGKTVQPSPIAGSISANRGALGQYTAVCLANNLGYETNDILHYFYGEDIKIESMAVHRAP